MTQNYFFLILCFLHKSSRLWIRTDLWWYKFALKTYYFIIDFFFTLILIYVQIFKNNTNLYYLQKFISSPFNYQLQIFEKRIDLHEEKNNQENPFISYYFSINTKWKFSRRKILNFFPNSTSLPTIITFFALLFRKR